MGLAVDFLERMRHDGEPLRRLHDRVADQVCERHFLTAGRELGIERFAPRVECGRRDVAKGRRRGDRQRLGHVGDEPGGGAGNWNGAGRQGKRSGRRDTRNGKRWCGGWLRFPFHVSRFPRISGYHRKLGQLSVIE